MRIREVLVISENLHNIGDVALLYQVVHGIRNVCGLPNIVVRQWDTPPDHVVTRLAGEGVAVSRSKWKYIFNRNRFVVVGGGQFVRANCSLKALLFLILSLNTSAFRGAALAIGGGKVATPFRKFLWRRIFDRFAVVAFRDRASRAAVEPCLNQSALSAVTCDLAFMPSPLHRALAFGCRNGVAVVAPCLSADENRLIDPARVAWMTGRLEDMLPAHGVAIVPHDNRLDVDGWICGKIAQAFAAHEGRRAFVVMESALEEVLPIYRDCAFVLTNRLHAMVFGLLAGKPVFVIDDGNPKLRAFAQRFDVRLLGPKTCEQDIADAVEHELSPWVRSGREELLNEAAEESLRNFDLLKELVEKVDAR